MLQAEFKRHVYILTQIRFRLELIGNYMREGNCRSLANYGLLGSSCLRVRIVSPDSDKARNEEINQMERSIIRPSAFHPPNSKGFSHRVFLYSLLLLLFSATLLWAQGDTRPPQPSLEATLDHASAKVGETIVLTMQYLLPEGARLHAEPAITGLEGLTVVGRQYSPGKIEVRLLVDQLDSWKTGPLELSYLGGDGMTHTLSADPVSLAVLSNLDEEPAKPEIRPIQGIIQTRAVWLQYLPWGAGVAALLSAVSVFLLWRRKRRTLAVPSEFTELPHLKARREIEELDARKLFEKGEVKLFYFILTVILRRYLESLRKFPAAEFTTEEIVRHVDNEQDRKLVPLLREADLVKFADAVPTPARKQEDIRTALCYIQETSPDAGRGNTTDAVRKVNQ